MNGLILSDDLLFASKVTTTGRAKGGQFLRCGTLPEFLLKLKSEQPSCLIVDLQHPGLNCLTLVAEAQQLATKPTLVGYGSHVDKQSLQAAKQAGFDVVMPRSQFTERIESDMASWLSAEG